MPLRDTLRSMAGGTPCSPEAAREAMKEIMGDIAPPAQVASFLTLLGATRDAAVVSACAGVMLDFALPIQISHPTSSPQPIVDIVGTGGDGADTFNVSTTGGLLMAACGCTVAKVTCSFPPFNLLHSAHRSTYPSVTFVNQKKKKNKPKKTGLRRGRGVWSARASETQCANMCVLHLAKQRCDNRECAGTCELQRLLGVQAAAGGWTRVGFQGGSEKDGHIASSPPHLQSRTPIQTLRLIDLGPAFLLENARIRS